MTSSFPTTATIVATTTVIAFPYFIYFFLPVIPTISVGLIIHCFEVAAAKAKFHKEREARPGYKKAQLEVEAAHTDIIAASRRSAAPETGARSYIAKFYSEYTDTSSAWAFSKTRGISYDDFTIIQRKSLVKAKHAENETYINKVINHEAWYSFRWSYSPEQPTEDMIAHKVLFYAREKIWCADDAVTVAQREKDRTVKAIEWARRALYKLSGPTEDQFDLEWKYLRAQAAIKHAIVVHRNAQHALVETQDAIKAAVQRIANILAEKVALSEELPVIDKTLPQEIFSVLYHLPSIIRYLGGTFLPNVVRGVSHAPTQIDHDLINVAVGIGLLSSVVLVGITVGGVYVIRPVWRFLTRPRVLLLLLLFASFCYKFNIFNDSTPISIFSKT